MTTAAEVIAKAAADNGYVEQPPGSNSTKYNRWYFGRDERAPWCATSLSKWFFDAGLALPASTAKGFAYTPAGAAYFKRLARWQGQYQGVIKVGHVVFFYWPSMGRIAHVGLVAKVNSDGSFHSWEGNTDASGGRTGGRVILQHRSRSTVGSGGGFGIPPYTAPAPIVVPTETTQSQEEEMSYRYVYDGGVYTTNMVHRQHWESGGPGFAIMERSTKDLGTVPQDFHESLVPAS